jgi:hypothetical protein
MLNSRVEGKGLETQSTPLLYNTAYSTVNAKVLTKIAQWREKSYKKDHKMGLVSGNRTKEWEERYHFVCQKTTTKTKEKKITCFI